MPPTLHPHLKRGLDFDNFYVNPEDVMEELPADYQGAKEQAAKRRRVEIIASQYLRGKPPVILSAGLRGPFRNGWKNPWANKSRTVTASSVENSNTLDQRSRRSRRNATQGISTTTARNSRQKEAGAAYKALQSASPEASRAAEDYLNLEAHQRDDSLDEVEVPPATAPLSEGDDVSGSAEVFSTHNERRIQNRSPPTNPFWLRRPGSKRKVAMNQPSNNDTQLSPTRSRSRNGHSQLDELQLALPRAPLHGQGPMTREAVLEECRSSASASMVISSPAKATNPTPNRRNDMPIVIGDPVRPTKDVLKSAANLEDSFRPTSNRLVTPNGQDADSSVREPHNADGDQYSQGTFTTRTSLAGHSKSKTDSAGAETPRATGHQIPQQSSRRSVQEKSQRRALHHDLVASPALGSSVGFIYRKVENSKRNSENAQTSPASIFSFTSSPVIRKDEQSPERTRLTPESGPCAKDTHQTNISDAKGASVLQSGDLEVQAKGNDFQEGQQDPISSRSSRNSAFSTQAAMRLAHIDFQESTFPTMSSDMPQPWTQPQNDSPRPMLPEPSPAMTPLSVFSAHLDKSLAKESVLRGATMNTQDLFAAASPFAFSTAKKRPELPQQSSLRFALLQKHEEQPGTNNTPAKSPTPSAGRRTPLKAKNTTHTSFWSFVTEKASQESLMDRSRRSVGDVELPQLDLNTSLDDFGPSDGLHFTDRFLRDLDDSRISP
ncbi:uncharacterized protein K460DRAFT_295607 [Cucurbitaria berberidis CBS 394.84]|uniref:Uncharacterized protein n=1 Tax=Cucurbitaria berberidis CBS 394.84 TaxID=1168544 RepID=A0A9P4L499_9PLEO|nr:uncharacterized protein K460DRAFT_295607 [Cucurbitaria berberidis CBS 394.84]KAF1841099.1 hypothetical protein K460DRAFT_295607 [Cucurbitaria berberidis CBS 394.84]